MTSTTMVSKPDDPLAMNNDAFVSRDSATRGDDFLANEIEGDNTATMASGSTATTAVVHAKGLSPLPPDGSSDNSNIFVVPGGGQATKKWPSVLIRLMNENVDHDEWRPVLDRIAQFPQEISIAGRHGGQNALHAACVRYPPIHVVQALVEACPEAALAQNFSGETPLHLASYSASEEVLELLVKYAPKAASVRDKYGDVPLHFCARQGASFSLMESMLKAAPEAISTTNRRGVTPFWLLPRSYLEADSLQEILDDQADEDGGDYADDWNLLVLFLRVSYFGLVDDSAAPRADTFATNPSYDWLVSAAAKTPACPREVLRFLCRMFPGQATVKDKDGFTPLLLACQVKELREPENWDETADGYREPVAASEGELQNACDVVSPEDRALAGGDAEFIQAILQQQPAPEDPQESVVEILLEWSPRSAFIHDSQDRLPLAHALLTDKSWRAVRALIAASPKALDTRDSVSGQYMFQLAAIHSNDLNSIYTSLRSLPILLQTSQQQHFEQEEHSQRKRPSDQQQQDGEACTYADKRARTNS